MCHFSEEAENERMHLLTALDLKEPSLLFRFCVIASQGLVCLLFPVTTYKFTNTLHCYALHHNVYTLHHKLLFIHYIIIIMQYTHCIIIFCRIIFKCILGFLPGQPKILPQVCWLPGGGGSENLHTLS